MPMLGNRVRLLIVGAAVAAMPVLALATATTATAAPGQPAAAVSAAGKAAAPPPCASGYAPITNYNIANDGIEGEGVNEPVVVDPGGNCFKAVNHFTYDSDNGYEYENGDGHCLWQDAGTIEVGANDCTAGHTNEEFVSVSDGGPGWLLLNMANQNGYVDAPSCEPGSYVEISENPVCPYWNGG